MRRTLTLRAASTAIVFASFSMTFASAGTPCPNGVGARGLSVRGRLVGRVVSAGLPEAIRPDFKCPPSIGECISITAGNPFTAEFCVTSGGSCTSGLIGIWDWTVAIQRLDDSKKAMELRGVWAPDPANPSVVTVSTSATTAKRTKVIAVVTLATCSSNYGSYALERFGITN